MKIRIFRSILVLFICFSLLGCSNEKESGNIKDITMSIKEDTLTSIGATIIIKDESKKNNTYGEFFRIDKKEKGKWKELKTVIKEYGFDEIAYSVNENNKLELEHNWEWLYGKLKKGQYRIVKKVNDDYISTEFNIG